MFWFFRYRIPYPSSTADPSDRLSRTLAQEKWKRITLDLTSAHVLLQHKLPFLFYNSWNPIFDGSFVTEGHQRYLIGYFRVHWFVLAFIVFFLLFTGYEALSTFMQLSVRPGYVADWKARELSSHFELFGFFVGINIIGWLVGLPYQRRIMAAIRESTAT